VDRTQDRLGRLVAYELPNGRAPAVPDRVPTCIRSALADPTSTDQLVILAAAFANFLSPPSCAVA
jgi:hypothetical protein